MIVLPTVPAPAYCSLLSDSKLPSKQNLCNLRNLWTLPFQHDTQIGESRFEFLAT
jgi:hypothetical protein